MATKPRSRKRKATDTGNDIAAEPETTSEVSESAVSQRVQPADDTNVSSFEGTLSVYGGILLIAAALFPRTFKQLFLLGMGAGFLYRGQSRHCHVYSALGIDTNKGSLVRQLNDKLLS
jgi:hypothetical protein